MYASQTIVFIASLAGLAHALPASTNNNAGTSLRSRGGQNWPFAAYAGAECKGDAVAALTDNGEQLWDNGGSCHTYSNVGSVAVGKLASNCRLYKYPKAQCGGKEERIQIILAEKDLEYVSQAPNTICMGENNYTSLGYECDSEDTSTTTTTTATNTSTTPTPTPTVA